MSMSSDVISWQDSKSGLSISRAAIGLLAVTMFAIGAGLMTVWAPAVSLILGGLWLFAVVVFRDPAIALCVMLASYPFTRDGVIMRIGIIDMRLLYLVQFLLIAAWLIRPLVTRGKLALPGRSVQVPMILLMGAALLSTLLNGISAVAVRELIQLALSIGTALTIFGVLRDSYLPVAKVVSIWLGSVCIVALVALSVSIFGTRALPRIVVQLRGLDYTTTVESGPPILYTTDWRTFYHRIELGLGAPYGAFPGLLATAALMSCSLLLSGNQSRNKGEHHTLVWLSFIIVFVMLLLTYTRSAWLGFLAGLALLLALERNLRRWLPVVVLLMSILILSPSGVFSRFGEIFGEESSKMGHLFLLDQAADVIRRSPVWGVGFGQVVLYVPGDIYSQGVGRGVLHSAMAQLWAELGTIGLLAFVSIPFCLFKSLLDATGKRGRNQDRVVEAAMAKGLVAGLVVLIGQAVFVPGLDMMFWFLLGLLMVINVQLSSGIVESDKHERTASIPHRKPS